MEKTSFKLEKTMTKDELKTLTESQAKAVAHKAATTFFSPWLTDQGSARFDKLNICWILKFGYTTFELTTDSLILIDSGFFSIS
jgi:hypothetical protein